MALRMLMVAPTSSRRDWPGFWRGPAVMTTMSASRQISRIVGAVDGHGRVEAGAVLHVEHFGLDAFLGDVFEHDLASDATLGSGEGEGGANGTGTNNSKLRGLNW